MENEDQNSQDLRDAYKALEIARQEYIAAEQKLLAAEALYKELFEASNEYEVWKTRQWDNRGEDDA